MKKRMSWHWALPAVIGLALIMVAALLSSSTISSPGIPGAHAQNECILDIEKEADDTTVAAGGEVTYTITLTNDASGDTAECTSIVVTEDLPNDLECVSVSVVEDEGLNFDEDAAEENCDDQDDIVWEANAADVLDDDDEVVFEVTVTTADDLDEDDEIENQVCVDGEENNEAVDQVCDTETITIGAAATSTPQPTATRQPTVAPPTVAPPPIVAPTVAPPIAPPATGTGSDSGSSTSPAIGAGLLGLMLLLASGAVLAKRTR